MPLRKASAYSKRYARPYTRFGRVKGKSYIKTVPPQKVVKFQMGNSKAFQEGKLKYSVKVIAAEDVQMRDNSLEATRQVLHKHLDTVVLGNYYFMVKVFPHHIIRENKMLTGAGSDRMSTGMQLAFGATTGRAVLLKSGKTIFEIHVNNERNLRGLKDAISSIKAKLPCRTRIEYSLPRENK